MSKIHDEVLARYYGCGLVLPEQLEGTSILDLGCGAGRDCYVMSCLVGPHGRVVGVDMTREQLEVARRYRSYHAEQFLGGCGVNTETGRNLEKHFAAHPANGGGEFQLCRCH